MPTGGDVRLNLDDVKQVLLSNDRTLLKKNEWMFTGDSKYLDGTWKSPSRIAFCSASRSGNSFYRKFLENITGITTGCALAAALTTTL